MYDRPYLYYSSCTPSTQLYTLSLHDALPISTCRKCPHKVHRMEMKTAISCTILRHTKILIAVGVSMVQLMAVFIDRKSGSAGMPRPSSYAVFCLKKTNRESIADCDRATTA